MRRLAAQRCVLHPKATLPLQNNRNEPPQQLSLGKKSRQKKLENSMCVCWSLPPCVFKRSLTVSESGDGHRNREGVKWADNLESLMWMTHIWLLETMGFCHKGCLWKWAVCFSPSIFVQSFLPVSHASNYCLTSPHLLLTSLPSWCSPDSLSSVN